MQECPEKLHGSKIFSGSGFRNFRVQIKFLYFNLMIKAWNKKAYLLTATLLLIVFQAQAQNMVLNPGLENYITCPGFGQFGNSWVNDWDKPSVGSSDFYHDSCPNILPPPGAAPHTGHGEGGIILYNFGTEYREYVTATLNQPLVAGSSYYVEFYLALNPGYIQAVIEAGAYFTDSMPGFFPNSLHINASPQVKNTGSYLSYGWNKISGYLIANGGETYVTIGNFNDDSSTTISQVGSIGSYGAYYFIDDVYVGLADSVPSGIQTSSSLAPLIYPNPAKVSTPITISIPAGGDYELSIFNSCGSLVTTSRLNGNRNRLPIEINASGLYFYRISDGDRQTFGKIMVLE